jgi:hypothetical protein
MEVNMKSLIRFLVMGIALVSIGMMTFNSEALFASASVTLTWKNNSEEDLSGYKLYYGLESGCYDYYEEANLDTCITVDNLENVTYYFVVTAYDIAGNESNFSEEVSWNPCPVGITGEGETIPGIPRSYNLTQNYPNPFNPSTTIKYSVGDGEGEERIPTSLKIYTMRGKLVKTLVDESRDTGEYLVHWNGTDSVGMQVASGTYIYRFQSGSYVSTRKMVLDK